MIPFSIQGGEFSASIPVAIGASKPALRRFVNVLALPTLLLGDVVQVNAQFEVTTPYLPYPVMLGWFLTLAEGPPSMVGRITVPGTTNIEAQRHHEVVSVSVAHIVGQDMAAPQLAIVAYAAHTQAKASDLLKIEQGYSQISGYVLRGEP